MSLLQGQTVSRLNATLELCGIDASIPTFEHLQHPGLSDLYIDLLEIITGLRMDGMIIDVPVTEQDHMYERLILNVAI